MSSENSQKHSSSETEKLLLLDVSSLVYRAYHALPELTAATGEPAGALYGFFAMLIKALRDRAPTHVAAAIDLPGKTFRHDVYEAYKATRPKTPEDLVAQLKRSQEALGALGVPVCSAQGYEADDAIAAIVRRVRKASPETRIEIVSNDADLFQLVDAKTSVLKPGRGVADIALMTSEEVREKLGVPPELVTAYKALRGDPSDNIPGIRGVGPKTAAALLTEAGSFEALLASAARPSAHPSREFTRFASALAGRREELLHTRDLVTLRSDAPVVFDFSNAQFRGLSGPAFSALLKRYGFEALLRRASAHAQETRHKKQDAKNLDTFVREQETQVRREIDEAETSGAFSKEIADLERALVPAISSMERRGVLTDRRALEELRKRFSAKRGAIEGEIYSLVGHSFNLASPKQLGEVLFSELGVASRRKTAGGQRSTAASALEELRGAHPVVDKVLAWREVTKLLTTYVETLPDLVDSSDGRIHAKFWQLGTATGRIASSEPNLQNIPVKTEDGRAVRNAFAAPEGALLLSADYEQIELRVAAAISGDSAMLQAFRDGRDFHNVTAQRVFGVAAEDVTKEMRRRAKVLNFGILYGMGPRRVGAEMNVSVAEAQAFLDEYLAAFSGLAAWIARTKEEARRIGATSTAFGRRRFFPELQFAQGQLRSQAERAAVNAPIQGTAADLVKRGMVRLAETVPDAAMIVQVHDEVLCEIPEGALERLAPHVRVALQSVWPDAPIAFPIRLSVGRRWGELVSR